MLFLDEIIAATKEPIVENVGELTGILSEFTNEYPGTFPWILIPADDGMYRLIRPNHAQPETTVPAATVLGMFHDSCCNFVIDKTKLPQQCCPETGQWDGALLQRIHSKKDGEIYLIMGFAGIADHRLVRDAQCRGLLAPLMSSVLKSYISRHAADRDASRLKAALDEVRVIKEKLLPPRDYSVEGVRFARHYLPFIAGGGDYFELFDVRLQRRRIGIRDKGYYWGGMIADVSGHGAAAAVEVAMMDAILRTYQPSYGFTTGEIIKYINRHLFTRQIRGHFATLLMYGYDGASNTLFYNSAGHPPGFIKHADPARGITVLDQSTGIPLGVVKETEWEGSQAEMFANDLLILYTDGISEAKNAKGRFFTRDRIIAAINACPRQEPQVMIDTIMEEVNLHRGGTQHTDDETILVLQPLANHK